MNDLPAPTELAAEDRKLITLARATRARTGAREGAACRDLDGRTYAAATVDLPSLRVSAIGVCVAMAIASGSKGLEAVVVLTDRSGTDQPGTDQPGTDQPGVAEADLAIVRDFAGEGVPVLLADARGVVGMAARS